VEKIAELLVQAGHVKVDKARELMATLSAKDSEAATGTG